MMDIYLNLGSNTGDSETLIGRAVALVLEHFKPLKFRVSQPYRSEPWGFESQNKFLNVGLGIRIDGDIEPLDVLHAVQEIERSLSSMPHRNPDGSYRDRELDIDIIEIPGKTICSDELTLPHPRASERDFVMIPLEQSRID